jgi:hypothetical protein
LSNAKVAMVAAVVPPSVKLPPVTVGLAQQLSFDDTPQLLAKPAQLRAVQTTPLPE